MKILVTGGAGFIGSAFIRFLIRETDASVVNVDKLTYAGNQKALENVSADPRYVFERVDICDRVEIARVFREHQPDAIVHLAAESHVDRSIDAPAAFVQTNIVGTYVLLEVARAYWGGLDPHRRDVFRFHHVSTDEVFGDLDDPEALFTEQSPYAPSSPYSASKASADHLVRAWQRTFHLPTLITNCSNNYGPYHYPEKLIPLTIRNALMGRSLPVYGQGNQIRDWLYVEDHARALHLVLTRGRVGETYNIGGSSERPNIDVVRAVCSLLEELSRKKPAGVLRYSDLITFVQDRPGHDMRYAIDPGKLTRELGWAPLETFDTGLRKTVQWYLDHRDWCDQVLDGKYDGERLGLTNRVAQ